MRLGTSWRIGTAEIPTGVPPQLHDLVRQSERNWDAACQGIPTPAHQSTPVVTRQSGAGTNPSDPVTSQGDPAPQQHTINPLRGGYWKLTWLENEPRLSVTPPAGCATAQALADKFNIVHAPNPEPREITAELGFSEADDDWI
ncbi:hypothetical protein KJY77_04930 [Canibacter sp. lx-72]|uniref:hypothetical protein n=1 Tax=Canibacter zhuwentaonis TaxID=2837491 RepID=UPI001BDC7CC3|nr:hypothetical protein [Canibacter zhuwentaonis]MBT1018479.1 hypothetical protein [Canibacter zhuwentaonis]MBT1035680.1 hypothetical protein [Canibacter zhuwentaonis]